MQKLTQAACPTDLGHADCRRWLLGLLVLQSSSSFVLDRYEGLLREHIFVTLFLVRSRLGFGLPQ